MNNDMLDMKAWNTSEAKANAKRDEGDENNGEPVPDEFDSMKVAQLKVLCKENGLKVSGKKADLQERLRGHYLTIADASISMHPEDDFETMPDDYLWHSYTARNLDNTGTRKELLERLRQDVSFSLELFSATADRSTDGYQSISEALEAAARGESALALHALDTLYDKMAEKAEVEIMIATGSVTLLSSLGTGILLLDTPVTNKSGQGNLFLFYSTVFLLWYIFVGTPNFGKILAPNFKHVSEKANSIIK